MLPEEKKISQLVANHNITGQSKREFIKGQSQWFQKTLKLGENPMAYAVNLQPGAFQFVH